MEAKCLKCDALFGLNGNAIPESMICVCNSTEFKLLAPITA